MGVSVVGQRPSESKILQALENALNDMLARQGTGVRVTVTQKEDSNGRVHGLPYTGEIQ